MFANIYYPQPLLPHFSREFGINPVISSLVISGPLLILGICFFIYSSLSDALGRKNMITMSLGLGVAFTFFIALAPSFESLVALRILQAACLAGVHTVALAYIGEEYSVRALSIAVGIYISSNSLGGMSGRLLGGMLTDIFNWRWAFVIMGLVSIACYIVYFILLPSSEHFKPRGFRWRTALTDYRLHLQNPVLLSAYLVGGLHFLVFIGIFNFITFRLSESPFYLSTTLLGFLFVTYLAGTFSSTAAGKISTLFGQPRCVAAGIAVMVLSMITTMVSNVYVIFIALLGLCFGFFFAHSSAISWVSYRAHFARASASGLYLSSYYFGGSLGSIYLGPFWSLARWPGVITGSLLIMLITTCCMLVMRKIEIEEEKEHQNNL